jgi:hypothetical protein
MDVYDLVPLVDKDDDTLPTKKRRIPDALSRSGIDDMTPVDRMIQMNGDSAFICLTGNGYE